MSKKIPITLSEPASDPDQVEAERHVKQIMGPAWSTTAQLAEVSDEIALQPQNALPQDDEAVSGPVSVNVPVQGTSSVPIKPETATPEAADVIPEQPTATHDIPVAETEGTSVAVPEITVDTPPKTTPNPTPEDTLAPAVVMKESGFERIKEMFYRWWDNKIARYVTLGVVAGILGVVIGVPAVRTSAMNLLGFRASVSVYAVDATTLQPLSGVTLSAGEKSAKTGQNGRVKLTGVKLGKQTVLVHKAGFADTKQQITFGFRAVDLGEIDMKATGLQLGFVLTDYLSGKPITDVVLESGESSTKSDKKGKAVITLAPDSTADSISVRKNGYRTEQLPAKGEEGSVKSLKLVLAAKEVFVARENGVYNLKKVDFDGKNSSVLLAGTGAETPSIDVSVDPLSQYAALISTRDSVKNKDGYLLSALTLVNISTGDNETIEHAEKLTFVGWSGTTLLYKQVVAGASAANASREKLMAYNYASNKRFQIASANHFLGAELHAGSLYFAVSSTDPNAKSGLVSTALDGSNKKTIQEVDAWGLYRTDYKTLKLQTASKWYAYTFGGSSVETQAVTSVSRTYLDSGDTKLSAWADTTAKNGVLSLYDIATGKEQVLTKNKGQYKPLRWINNRVLMYREAAAGGATDYVLSLDGGDAVKVADTYAF